MFTTEALRHGEIDFKNTEVYSVNSVTLWLNWNSFDLIKFHFLKFFTTILNRFAIGSSILTATRS